MLTTHNRALQARCSLQASCTGIYLSRIPSACCWVGCWRAGLAGARLPCCWRGGQQDGGESGLLWPPLLTPCPPSPRRPRPGGAGSGTGACWALCAAAGSAWWRLLLLLLGLLLRLMWV